MAKRFAALALSLTCAGVRSLQAESWTAAAPHPVVTNSYAFAQDGEDMYVIGGYANGASTAVRRYNATTNFWTSLADVPHGSWFGAAVFYEGKIYLADNPPSVGPQFRIYDVATNTWSSAPPRPNADESSGAAAGAFDGKIYIAGGRATNVLSIYNITSNTWSTGPAPPAHFFKGGYTQVGQFLYLIGSQKLDSLFDNSSVSMRLDMANNTWSIGPTWTPQRADFALAAAGTRLFALGGNTNAGVLSPSAQVDELDTSTWPSGTWVPSPDHLPSPRQSNQAGFFSTGRARGEIWSTGGVGPTGAPNGYLDEHLFRPVPVPCLDYDVTQSTRNMASGSSDSGSHCDNCMTATTGVHLPFPVRFYGTLYSSVRASSNGNLQFNSEQPSQFHSDLPARGFNATIFAFWDNLRTDIVAGTGIYTAVGGNAPNRTFTIEWRVSDVTGSATTNFAIRFFEGSTEFEILYGETVGTFSGTIGVQRDANSLFTQYAGPNANVPPAGTRLLFTADCCAPIAFRGAIGSNSATYPGASGVQRGRLTHEGSRSECGTAKPFPGTTTTTSRAYDEYAFTNNGPATCVTFEINSRCASDDTPIFAAAYLGSFNPANLAANYLGDQGFSQFGPIFFSRFSVDVPANATVVLVVHEQNPGASCAAYDVVVKGAYCPLELLSAVSRKRHGLAGDFRIRLPLTGEPAVECRGTNGNHAMVFTFAGDRPITAGNASVTQGGGTAGAPTFSGATMTVPLSGVADMQKITVSLSGIANDRGQTLPDFGISMNLLLGDTNGDKAVNVGDALQTRTRAGQTLNGTNFRSDVNLTGTINSGDAVIIRNRSGNSVP